ncbi:MAG: topoisomerase C-terminal repeat-containing protein, partial [Pseudomonadota bacterium]
LVWKRTLASQMEAARLERTTVDIGSADSQIVLRATGQVVTFDGFMKVYEEGRDDVEDEDSKRLPQIHDGEDISKVAGALNADFQKLTDPDAATDVIERDVVVDGMARAKNALLAEGGAVLGQQHFTQPPPRYTEATLIKRMEELGIGRPSTYTSIVSTIQERSYVRKEKNRLFPEDKGRLVVAFLENYFRRYMSYDFTAKLEEELDLVSDGQEDYQKLLERFWKDFSAALDETADLRITEVLEKINEVLEPHLFPAKEDGSDPRLCPNCGAGRLSMRTARSGGAFIGCSNYPECRYTRPLAGEVEGGDVAGPDGKMLGSDPETGMPVTLRAGRFGPYVQLGDVTEETPKPKRSSVPKGMELEAVDLAKALDMLRLPRYVGEHPEGGPIETNIGRFGPYVMHTAPAEGKEKPKKIYANLADPDEVLTLGLNRAVTLIEEKKANPGRRAAAAEPLKTLGDHPDGGPVAVMKGRYGPYVKWEKINATIPKDMPPEDVTMDLALELIEAKAGAKKKPTKKAAAKKPAAKKTTAKKTTAKKPASKAVTAKKTAAET